MSPAGTAIGARTFRYAAGVRNANNPRSSGGRGPVVEKIGVAGGEVGAVEIAIGDRQLQTLPRAVLTRLRVPFYNFGASEAVFLLALGGTSVAGYTIGVITGLLLVGIDIAIATTRDTGLGAACRIAAGWLSRTSP